LIIVQFDKAYYHWGLLMLQSLQLHEPRPPVLCETINLTDPQVAALRSAHENIEVVNDASNPDERAPVQMATRKPFVILRAMERYPAQPWYGLLDVDFLVRKPLGPLWLLLDYRPAALCINNGMWNGKYYRRLVTASMIVLVRRDGKKLIDNWAKWFHHDQPLDSLQPMDWLWDQITLAEAWSESGVECAVIPMNVYSDDQLRPSAAIWHANVPEKKLYYELFRKEYQRQRATLGR